MPTKFIDGEIFRLRRLLEDYLARGTTADVEKIRNEIQDLERARQHPDSAAGRARLLAHIQKLESELRKGRNKP